jgi:hypothetical protein
MISDVLHDALIEIERYQTDPVFASAYSEPQLKAKIEAVKGAMRDLQHELDAPPRDIERRHERWGLTAVPIVLSGGG